MSQMMQPNSPAVGGNGFADSVIKSRTIPAYLPNCYGYGEETNQEIVRRLQANDDK